MDTYVILRRSGWSSPEELQEAAARSSQVGDEEMSDDIRWIRSYVLEEDGGSVGTVCVYQATSPDKVREHASRARPPGRRGDQGRRHGAGPAGSEARPPPERRNHGESDQLRMR